MPLSFCSALVPSRMQQHLGIAAGGKTLAPGFKLGSQYLKVVDFPVGRSIELKCVLVIELKRWILLFFLKKAVADHKRFDVGAHEATKCVSDCADDRFAADIETGIDQDRTPGELLESDGATRDTEDLCPWWTVWMRAE